MNFRDYISEAVSSLIPAAKKGDLELIQELIDRGECVNAEDKTGKTAMHYAAKSDDNKMLALLVKNNANINFEDKKGVTPFFTAVKGNKIDFIKELVRLDDKLLSGSYSGNSVGKEDEEKCPLYYAVRAGKKKVAEFMLQSKFTPNSEKSILNGLLSANRVDIKIAKLIIDNGYFNDSDLVRVIKNEEDAVVDLMIKAKVKLSSYDLEKILNYGTYNTSKLLELIRLSHLEDASVSDNGMFGDNYIGNVPVSVWNTDFFPLLKTKKQNITPKEYLQRNGDNYRRLKEFVSYYGINNMKQWKNDQTLKTQVGRAGFYGSLDFFNFCVKELGVRLDTQTVSAGNYNAFDNNNGSIDFDSDILKLYLSNFSVDDYKTTNYYPKDKGNFMPYLAKESSQEANTASEKTNIEKMADLLRAEGYNARIDTNVIYFDNDDNSSRRDIEYLLTDFTDFKIKESGYYADVDNKHFVPGFTITLGKRYYDKF